MQYQDHMVNILIMFKYAKFKPKQNSDHKGIFATEAVYKSDTQLPQWIRNILTNK